MSATLAQIITAYLTGGGLFNPELANHDAVRDLLIDCREAFARAAAQEPVAWHVPLMGAMHIVYGKRPDTEMPWEPLYAAPPAAPVPVAAQEPVAWQGMRRDGSASGWAQTNKPSDDDMKMFRPLYAAPPAAPVVGGYRDGWLNNPPAAPVEPIGMVSAPSGNIPYKHFVRTREPRDDEVGMALYAAAAPVPSRDAAGNFIGNPTDPAWEESMAAPVEPPARDTDIHDKPHIGMGSHLSALNMKDSPEITAALKAAVREPPAQDAEWVEDIGLVDALFDEEPKYALCLRTRAAYQIKRDRTRLAALTAELARVTAERDAAIDESMRLDGKEAAAMRARAESAERKLAQAMRAVEAARGVRDAAVENMNRHIQPGGRSDAKFISGMYGIFDGPLQRTFDTARAALSDKDKDKDKGQGS